MPRKRKYATHEEYLAASRARQRARYAAMTPEEKATERQKARERYLRRVYGIKATRGIQSKAVIEQRQKDMTPDRRHALFVWIKFLKGEI